MLRRLIGPTLAAALAAGSTFVPVAPADAHHGVITGLVTDATTGLPLDNVCVTVGPPISCFTATNAQGQYRVDLAALGVSDGLTWGLHFLRAGFVMQKQTVVVDGPTTLNVALVREPGTTSPPPATSPANLGQPPPPVTCPAQRDATATISVFLPNITKTLGGPTGWQTPFIVQNTGSQATDVEVSFYRFDDGSCSARITRLALAPGTSQAFSPNHLGMLRPDSQFSVVVRSFGANVVAVVNEHAGSDERAEALSYIGASSGARSVFLPNIVRRFFGWVSPFIIQNLGSQTTTATARFVSFDGSAPTVTASRTIEAGRSKFVDPNSDDPALGAPGLRDGKQYAVTVTATERISVVVNTHNDAPGTAAPVAYSANGVAVGAPTIYGAYGAKNAGGVGRVTTIVVQNLGTTDITPSLTFLRLGASDPPQLFVSPKPVSPGGAWAFDPRFRIGTTEPCSVQSSSCLGEGEYSFIARSGDDTTPIAAAVNVVSSATAMGYTAASQPAAKYFLPNITRTLCFCARPSSQTGWTTPILLQGVTATSAELRWFRFADGVLAHTQRVDLPPRGAVRIDPRNVPQLSDDTQYAVVVQALAGTLNAIVQEFAPGGDNAMTYEGFPEVEAVPAPGPTPAPSPTPTPTPTPTPAPQ